MMMAGQTQTGALLHNDHVATIQALQNLENFLTRQTARKVPDVAERGVQTMLRNLIATIGNEVGRHFGFEENYLFPLLADRGEEGIGEFLRQEHLTILPLAEQMAGAARDALADGFNPQSWAAFHATGLELIEREIFHIQKEEMGLLAAIGMLVDPEADRELAERYHALQDAA